MGESQNTEEIYPGNTIRAGLSEKDRDLPIRQNILRVFSHTPELQILGSAYQSGDEGRMQTAFTQAALDVNKYYGIELQVFPDKDVARITNNPDNKVTLQGKTIVMAQSVRVGPKESVREFAHELGAYRLIEIYGSKKDIPSALPKTEPDGPLLSATHYLDIYVLYGRDDHIKTLGNLQSKKV